MAGRHFSEVTQNNSAGVIWIISLLGLVYSVLAFVTRGFIKWRLLGLDDYTLIVAQVFALAQYGALFASLDHGLGVSSELLTSQSRTMTSQTAMTSQILLILSLGMTKCSVIFLIRRVFTRDMKHSGLICDIIVGFVCVWAVGSVVAVSAGCNKSNYVPPNGNETCSGFAARWNVVTALDVVSEALIVLLPVYFLWTVQMALDLKARVVLAFSFRIPVAAFAIMFVRAFTTTANKPNRGVAISTAIIWHQIEVAYSLISATIPCLKSFISSFDTNFGMGDGSGEGHYNYGSGNSLSNQNSGTYRSFSSAHKSVDIPAHKDAIESYPLRPLHPKNSQSEPARSEKGRRSFGVGKLRPERVRNSTTVSVGVGPRDDGRTGSRGSAASQTGSQELIIRRGVHFGVTSHDAQESLSIASR